MPRVASPFVICAGASGRPRSAPSRWRRRCWRSRRSLGLLFVALGETGDIWAAPRALCDSGRADADRAAAGGRRRGDHRGRRRHRLDRHHLRVPGPRRAHLAAAAAARDPDLHRGLRLRRHSRRARAGAVGAARDLRLALRRRLLVPGCALARRRHLRHRLRALPVRLSRRARDVPDARLAVRGSRAHARRAAVDAGAAASRCRWRGPRSRSGSRSRCSRRSTTSAPANISACRP